MKKYSVFFYILLCFAFVACNIDDNNKKYPTPDEEIKKPYEAPKKSEKFYQHLLERFCQQYYDDCFKRRTYHNGSLVVKDLSVVQGHFEGENIVRWEMLIEGIHSFEGVVVNYNDKPFTAFVDDLGNDDYKITFSIHRYDIFGEEMSDREDATRTMKFIE